MSAKGTSTDRSKAWVLALTGVGLVDGRARHAGRVDLAEHDPVDLGASIEELEWTVNAYNLSFAVLLITAAGARGPLRAPAPLRRRPRAVRGRVGGLRAGPGRRLADRGARRPGGRRGAGADLALALLSAAFPPERRGAAIGIFSAITGISVASGPLVGGAVVEGIAWEWIFWLNVPIGLVAIPLVLTRIEESFGGDTGLDIPGLALVTGGAFGIVWGLVRGNAAGWGSLEVVGALAAGVLLVAAFVAWELRAREPMLPMRFFRSRAFSAGNAAIFFTFASLFTGVFFFAQLLQTVLGYGPLDAGLRLVPWTATFITVAPIAGALADRFGERPFMVGGLLAADGWDDLDCPDRRARSSPTPSWSLPFIVAGVGVSMAIPSAQNSVVGSVAPRRSARRPAPTA